MGPNDKNISIFAPSDDNRVAVGDVRDGAAGAQDPPNLSNGIVNGKKILFARKDADGAGAIALYSRCVFELSVELDVFVDAPAVNAARAYRPAEPAALR